jgi:hypothetical protein
MGERKTFNITVEDTRPIHLIQQDLEAAGLQDVQVLEAIGVISGSADEDHLARLQSVAGVSDVAADVFIDLGPPGADVTW